MKTPIDTERLHVIAAQLKLWLLDVLLWVSHWVGGALPRDVRMMMRDDIRDALAHARMIIVILAVAKWAQTTPTVPGPRAARRPHGAPRGVRSTDPFANDLRNLRRIVRLRGRGIAARLAALRDVFDDLDAWTARIRVRIDAALRGVRLLTRHAGTATRLLRATFHVVATDSS